MRVAFVHDWLDTYRGGERVLETMLEFFPDAPIYTLFYKPENLPKTITARSVFTPPALNYFRPFRKLLLPFLPALIESFDLRSYDLIISTSSAVAKGAIPGPLAKHICYIHTPMRYIWDQNEEYFKSARRFPLINFLFQNMASKLRIWDVASLPRVDYFIANSNFVKKRIGRYYGRDAKVIHPPVHTERFKSAPAQKADYYLAAGAFVPYKRFDLAIQACEILNRKLIVAGSGPELENLKELETANTTFEINPSNERWVELLANAKALIFPGVEDFGIVPIEAMASGTPVIAFQAGGALDYVIPEKTGVFFNKQDPEILANAIMSFENMSFDVDELQAFAERFDKKHFADDFISTLQSMIS